MRVFGYARHLSCTTALFFPSFLAVVRDIPQTPPRLERLCNTMFLVFLSRRIGWSACVDLEGTGFNYGCVPMARWSHPVETPTKSFLLCVSTDNVTVALRFFLAMFKSSPREPELTSQISSIVRACVATSRHRHTVLSLPVYGTLSSFPRLRPQSDDADISNPERVQPAFIPCDFISLMCLRCAHQAVATVLLGGLRVGGHCYVRGENPLILGIVAAPRGTTIFSLVVSLFL